MIEGLVLLRTDFLWNGQPPLLGVCEDWINVENDAAEREQAVSYDLTNLELCFSRIVGHVRCSPIPIKFLT
jgi:hypothetical protein